MSFNDDARIDSSKVKRRGRTAGVAGGGVGVVAIAVFLIAQFTGVDLSGVLSGGDGSGSGAGPQQIQSSSLDSCTTGADANANIDCRMAGAADSLDTYWSTEAPKLDVRYDTPDFFLFTDSTTTGCGGASSSTGPFYCPPDQALYVDTAFFDQLRQDFGATAGPLAQMYVVGHEWGHHIQQESGSFDTADRTQTGPGSDTVRLELQADCYAGAWVGAASTTTDSTGTAFLAPVTRAEVADALDAAAAVGDDRIQAASGSGVDSDSWTHGSSAQRQKWFEVGRGRGAASCDTFGVSAGAL